MQTTCSQCHKPINRQPWEVRTKPHLFCSHTCQARFYHPKITIVELECFTCGILFTRKVHDAKQAHHSFCCKEHYWEWKTSSESTYYNRDLESSPKQRLVH